MFKVIVIYVTADMKLSLFSSSKAHDFERDQ